MTSFVSSFPDFLNEFEILRDEDGECPDDMSNPCAQLVIRVNILTGNSKFTAVGLSNKFFIVCDDFTCETSLEDILSKTDEHLTTHNLKRRKDELGSTECAVVRNSIEKPSSNYSELSTMTLEGQTLVRNQS